MPTNETTDCNDPDIYRDRLYALAAPEDRSQLEAAYALAARAHSNQWRRVASGVPPVPYIVHPLRVACILAEEWGCRDRRALTACLLHDVLEDVPEADRARYAQEIRKVAGKEVHDAIWTLTKPAPGPAEVKAARDARYFSELRNAPRWVRLIKCADRVDNLRDARAWGDKAFWERYSSETIGWHLYLARETAPIAEVALFGALVAGERDIRGRVPVWVDGHLVDPSAAALIPEEIARHRHAIGLALRGDTLLVAMLDPDDEDCIITLGKITGKRIAPVSVSAEGLRDAQVAGLFKRMKAEG
ncbi:MAG TPA: HD domain-containing protein [Chthonomonadaceae bacterium]|nr:HD domain-containing protein [Chthonomonadaceae bacterium]